MDIYFINLKEMPLFKAKLANFVFFTFTKTVFKGAAFVHNYIFIVRISHINFCFYVCVCTSRGLNNRNDDTFQMFMHGDRKNTTKYNGKSNIHKQVTIPLDLNSNSF